MEKAQTDPVEDYKGFYEEFQNESPRAAVIVGAAFLDAQLRQVLASFLVDDEKAVDALLGGERNNAPLQDFAARISAAYCLGLISKDEHDDLNLIRKIRNRFAHRLHDLSFDDQDIIAWCNSLRIPRKLPLNLGSHRDIFLVCIAELASRLGIRARSVASRRCVRFQSKASDQVFSD